MTVSAQFHRSPVVPTALLGLVATAACTLLLLLPAGHSRMLADVLADVARIPLYYLSSDLYYDVDEAPLAWQVPLLFVLLCVIPALRVHRLSTGEVRLPGDHGTPGATAPRTVTQVRRLARETGIPWDDHFATPGGARVLLDIANHRQEQHRDPRREEMYASLAVALRSVASSLPDVLRAEETSAPHEPTSQPIPAEEPGGPTDQPAVREVGSVYTSTTLYQSARTSDDDAGEER